MALQVVLHFGHDDDNGVEAWETAHLGFSTWGASRAEVLAKVPSKVDAYRKWCGTHQIPVPEIEPTIPDIEECHTSEGLFRWDTQSASSELIELTATLLAASHRDLMTTLGKAPAAALSWDPPYRNFAHWADWRTIRANLAHVANAETNYYCRVLGHKPRHQEASAADEWRDFLPRARAETLGFLARLATSEDLLRLRQLDLGYGPETWTVRKSLRRLVSHELVHWKSITRIIDHYVQNAQKGAS